VLQQCNEVEITSQTGIIESLTKAHVRRDTSCARFAAQHWLRSKMRATSVSSDMGLKQVEIHHWSVLHDRQVSWCRSLTSWRPWWTASDGRLSTSRTTSTSTVSRYGKKRCHESLTTMWSRSATASSAPRFIFCLVILLHSAFRVGCDWLLVLCLFLMMYELTAHWLAISVRC